MDENPFKIKIINFKKKVLTWWHGELLTNHPGDHIYVIGPVRHRTSILAHKVVDYFFNNSLKLIILIAVVLIFIVLFCIGINPSSISLGPFSYNLTKEKPLPEVTKVEYALQNINGNSSSVQIQGNNNQVEQSVPVYAYKAKTPSTLNTDLSRYELTFIITQTNNLGTDSLDFELQSVGGLVCASPQDYPVSSLTTLSSTQPSKNIKEWEVSCYSFYPIIDNGKLLSFKTIYKQ